MTRKTLVLGILALLSLGPVAYAMYEVMDHGDWPPSWPRELEPLRKQSRTLVGPTLPHRHDQIPFTQREQFESAWPALLKVKTSGAPIILTRPGVNFLSVKPAGVLVHEQLERSDGKGGSPIEGVDNVREKWMYTTFIELAVDGSIVDLNRIALPQDTPIIDERFTAPATTAPAR